MSTLGIDPSLTGFGWCVHNNAVAGPARVLGRGVIATGPNVLYVQRYRYLREFVKLLKEAFPCIQNVGVESPIYGETWSEGAYGLYSYVSEALYELRLDTVFFDPSTVKSLAKRDSSVRRGTMDKGDMRDAASSDTGIPYADWDHNEADAYIVARSGAIFWALISGELTQADLTPSELSSFTTVLRRENARFFRFSSKDFPAPPLPTIEALRNGTSSKKASNRRDSGEGREGGQKEE